MLKKNKLILVTLFLFSFQVNATNIFSIVGENKTLLTLPLVFTYEANLHCSIYYNVIADVTTSEVINDETREKAKEIFLNKAEFHRNIVTKTMEDLELFTSISIEEIFKETKELREIYLNMVSLEYQDKEKILATIFNSCSKYEN